MGREVVVAITDGELDLGPWEQIFTESLTASGQNAFSSRSSENDGRRGRGESLRGRPFRAIVERLFQGSVTK